ncbi:cytochrome b [Shimia sagamensis]|uniref:Cytochrome b561 n=1 Tax=Shimia sagamensis TaxID=1566352 RepID=A0ABY1NLP1_9RHOB|nr:cytochrome b [Shimia sagamensis]SMP10880.1 cytochrome b561 [Shimia sagamensis]
MAQQQTAYDRMSRLNHWLVAVLMIGMLAGGIYMSQFLPRGPEKQTFMGIHKSIGLVVLILGSWRVYWRLRQGFLAAVQDGWQTKLAHWAHVILLVGIVVMPMSGVMMSYFGGREIGVFGLFAIPGGPEISALKSLGGAVHGIFAKLMIATVLLHILGALKHVVMDKDGTWSRMTGRS